MSDMFDVSDLFVLALLVSKRCFADGQSLDTPVTNIQGTRASFLACSELKPSI